ncbi:MAG: outer membrane protein assembly factor BamD [Nitrospira sp. NTP1]|nr:outer membrane protein assembly factor BamD [Nitrospira sp. NTP1]
MQQHSRDWCVRIAVMVGLLCFSAGCSSKPKTTAQGKPVSGTDEQIFLGDTIEKNYDPNVIMKRGEAFFDKEEFAEAIVEYQHFLELHRSHQLAVYAQFRLAESHLRMGKSIDRDPDPIQKAIAAFEKLRKDFPNSKYEAQALQRLADCHDWLAQTHLFVGQFYYRSCSFWQKNIRTATWREAAVDYWPNSRNNHRRRPSRPPKKRRLHRTNRPIRYSRLLPPRPLLRRPSPTSNARRVLPCPNHLSHAVSVPGADAPFIRLTTLSQM